MNLLANIPAQAMFAVGVLMLIVLLFRRIRRYQRKTQKEQSSGNRNAVNRHKLDEARAATPLLDAPPELLRWHVAMHETARDLTAELDSKMSALQSIIRVAGEEYSRLEAAIARAEQLGVSPRADTLATIEELSGCDDSSDRVLLDLLPVKTDEIAARRDAIYQLADQGLAASAIAQSIDAPLGDVELLMSLRTDSASQDVG